MQSTTFSVGDPIEARCTKCRKTTNHIVVAIVKEVPVKVQCNTCSGQHKYRPPTATKKPSVRRTVDPKIAERKEWEGLAPDMNAKTKTHYTMTTAFKVGAVMDHPVFGVGIVQSLGGPGKVKVLFEDGLKTMRCK